MGAPRVGGGAVGGSPRVVGMRLGATLVASAGKFNLFFKTSRISWSNQVENQQ